MKPEPTTARVYMIDGYASRKPRLRREAIGRWVLFAIRAELGLHGLRSAVVTVRRSRRGAWALEPAGDGRAATVRHRGKFLDVVCIRGFRRITGFEPIGRFTVTVTDRRPW